jgi:dTDP-4-amino-4,6-dideoxygalactose transaminase
VPAHRQPALASPGAPALPETERLVREILSLPLSAGHTEAEIDQVAEAVRTFFAR